MQIIVRTQGMPVTEGMRVHVERRLSFALDRFADRVRRVEVRCGDANGPRGGVDKRCALAIHLWPGDTVRVEELADDLYVAMDRAVHRASRAMGRAVSRARRTQAAAER